MTVHRARIVRNCGATVVSSRRPEQTAFEEQRFIDLKQMLRASHRLSGTMK
jgi:hypothetical protein